MNNVDISCFPEMLTPELVRGMIPDIGGSTRPHHGFINGREYVLKCGSFSPYSSNEHVHNEYVADCLLRAAGCLVPVSREYFNDIGHGRKEMLRLAEFIPNGRCLTQAFREANAEERQMLIRQIVETYPVVSFLSDYDSYRHYNLDNVLVDQDYNLWFIDNGASFDFRARGKRKNWFWQRTDAEDVDHGYFYVYNDADGELHRILKNVSQDELKAAAAKYDFLTLFDTLPDEYRQPSLLAYARSLENWSKGCVPKRRTRPQATSRLSDEECDYLEHASLVIAKAVRRINRFLDKGKSDKTANSRTMDIFRDEVDENRLSALAKKDPTGRVNKLLQVCDDIANAEASGFAVRVLANLWHPNEPSQQRPGRMGNVDFSDLAFDRRLLQTSAATSASDVLDDTADKPKIRVVKGDVASIVADAVVNAANEHLLAGRGVCGAIFRRAGLEKLQPACNMLAPCPTGEVRVTPAFGITNAKYIIHAVGPRYTDGRHGEPDKLAACYRNLLAAAVEKGCKSVAVPSISTGIFHYPLEDAARIAVRETKAFLETHDGLEVVFVAWDNDTESLYRNLLSSCRQQL